MSHRQNNFTKVDLVFPLNSQQAEFAVSVLDCIQNEQVCLDSKASENEAVNAEAYNVARKCVLGFNRNKDKESFGYSTCAIGFGYEIRNKGINIFSEGFIDLNKVSFFVKLMLRHFDLDICVFIDIAHIYDEAEGGSGGGAVFVTKNTVKSLDTKEWLNEQKASFEKQLAKKLVA